MTQGLSKTITEKRVLTIGGFVCLLIMILLLQITNSTPNTTPSPPKTAVNNPPSTPERMPLRIRQPDQARQDPKALSKILTTPPFYLIKLTTHHPKTWVHAQGINIDQSQQKEMILTGILENELQLKANFSLEEHHNQELDVTVSQKNWYQHKHVQLNQIPKTQIRLTVRPFGEVSIDNGQTFYSSPHTFAVLPGEHIVQMKKHFGSAKFVKSLLVQDSLHQECTGDFSNFNNRLLCQPLKIETKTAPGTSPAPLN